jgi:four helix bundle protein
MRDHTKLKVFQLADQLAVHIYQSTRNFPAEEKYGLSSQMRRAAVSTPCNIVEGCARNTEKDFLRFLDIAYGSARELEYQVSLATRLGYLDKDKPLSLQNGSEEVSKTLNGLIRKIRKS